MSKVADRRDQTILANFVRPRVQSGWSWRTILENPYRPPKLTYHRRIRKPGQSLAVAKPKLAAQFWEERNGFSARNIFANSNLKVWWKCVQDSEHVWVGRPNWVKGCPYCSKRLASRTNNFKTLNPTLATEWSPLNGKWSPEDFTPSSGIKALWICKDNPDHPLFVATVANRNKNGSGCPQCAFSRNSSRPEFRILSELSVLMGRQNVRHRAKVANNEVDVLLPAYGIGIEFDGRWHHRSPKKQLSDAKKLAVLEENLIVIRLRGEGLSIERDLDIAVNKSDENNNRSTPSFIFDLAQKLAVLLRGHTVSQDLARYANEKTLIAEDMYQELLANWHKPTPGNSLADRRTNVWDFWDPVNSRFPDQVVAGSNDYFKLLCPECGHKWEMNGFNIRHGYGCPKCGRKEAVKKSHNTIIAARGSLMTLRPDIAKYYCLDCNKLAPERVALRHNSKVWWLCQSCGNNFLQTVANRVRLFDNMGGKNLCPNCGRRVASMQRWERRIEKLHAFGKSLLTKYPQVALHFDKKNETTPDLIAPKSAKLFWWWCYSCKSVFLKSAGKVIRIFQNNGIVICSQCTRRPGLLRQIGREGQKLPTSERLEKMLKKPSLADRYPQVVPLWTDQIMPQDLTCGTHYKVRLRCSNLGCNNLTVTKQIANICWGYDQGRKPLCVDCEKVWMGHKAKSKPPDAYARAWTTRRAKMRHFLIDKKPASGRR